LSIASTLQRNGFVFLARYMQERETYEIVEELGLPVRLGPGSAVHALTPNTREEALPNTYSGLYGLDAFPFHTDFAHWTNPPRYLLLRAIIGYSDVATLVVDSRHIVSEVGIRPLQRALVKPRRRRRNVATSLLRIYEQRSDLSDLIRWDETFIRPASDAGVIGTSLFSKTLSSIEPCRVALAERGDTLIIDNWRMLHARGPVCERCRDRRLNRVYLEHVH
jgi:hypothetical protein